MTTTHTPTKTGKAVQRRVTRNTQPISATALSQLVGHSLTKSTLKKSATQTLLHLAQTPTMKWMQTTSTSTTTQRFLSTPKTSLQQAAQFQVTSPPLLKMATPMMTQPSALPQVSQHKAFLTRLQMTTPSPSST